MLARMLHEVLILEIVLVPKVEIHLKDKSYYIAYFTPKLE